MEATRTERRRSPRMEVILRFEYLDPADLLDDYITDLGAGGLFLRTNVPFPIGQRLRFCLTFPGLLEPLELEGVVRWRRGDERNQQGLGLEFIWSSHDQRVAVLDLLELLGRQQAQNALPAEHCFRVLLVEDNEFARELFIHSVHRFHRERIGQGTVDVVCATSASEALCLLGAESFDVAVVDHYLPGMTGCQLIRHARAELGLSKLPILMVSVGGDEVRSLARAAGADLFLDKPVMNRQLVQTLAALLQRNARSQPAGRGDR